MRSAILMHLVPLLFLLLPPDLKLTADKPTPAAGDLVTVTAETPAKSIRWKVVGDAQSKVDSSGRSVVVVVKSGTVTVFAVAAVADEQSEFAEVVFKSAEPLPKPAPGPKPDPTPAAAVKIKMVTVYESEEASTGSAKFFADKALAARWKDKGHLPWVNVDQNTKDPDTNATPAKLKPYIDRAAGKTLPQTYLMDSATGTILYEGPRPETPAALILILDKIGG